MVVSVMDPGPPIPVLRRQLGLEARVGIEPTLGEGARARFGCGWLSEGKFVCVGCGVTG